MEGGREVLGGQHTNGLVGCQHVKGEVYGVCAVAIVPLNDRTQVSIINQTQNRSHQPFGEAPGSSYLGLYDFSGFEGSEIMIFLSVISGFEAHGKNFCDILVQLSGFEDKFSKNFAY